MSYTPSVMTGGLLAALLALALAACGGSSSTSESTIEAAPAPAVTSAAADAPTPPEVPPPDPETEPGSAADENASSEPDAPDPQASLDSIALEEIVVLEQPLDLTIRPDDESLYIAEKTGRVRVVSPDGSLREEPFLDLSGRVSTDSERGLLSITFAPDGSRFYAHYSDTEGSGHLASWALAGNDLDLTSEIDHLAVAQPYSTHNGGQIAFGPDGFLYWGLGDGGSGGDPEANGQNLATLLGSILRIEPRVDAAAPYGVPPDNPFVDDASARPEIWAWGLRNPWRFSFDADGGLWIGDVGEGAREEVDYLPANSASGANLGWNALEGTAPFAGEAPADAIDPVFEYDHGTGTSITGGYVYRGDSIPALRGWYVFGDFGAGFLAALSQVDGTWRAQRLPVEVPLLTSFGEDGTGELYALSYEGPVYRLTPG